MDASTNRELFLDSLNRCTQSTSFIAAFYNRFLNESDEIREKFRKTDFQLQIQLLRNAMRLIAEATEGKPAALRELIELAETHNRYHMNIKPELYETWLEVMIATAQNSDPLWSDRIKQAWQTILGNVIRQMVKRY